MAKIDIPFYVIKRNSRAYWMPQAALKRLGFACIPLGPDGPDAWAKARKLNEDAARALRDGEQCAGGSVYPAGTLGDFFGFFQQTEAWEAKEGKSQEDYHRVWPVIAAAEVDGRRLCHLQMAKISSAHSEGFHRQMHALATRGDCSDSHRYRVLKVWRALLNAAVSYNMISKAPIGKISNPQPIGRSSIFLASEIIALQAGAEAKGRFALALGIGIAHDTGLSPVDVRELTRAKIKGDGSSRWIETTRRKTKATQKHALTEDTCARLDAYFALAAAAGVIIEKDAPLLRQPDGWRPYVKDRWERHFRWTREEVMPGDTRVMLDLRRTANVEADIGGMSLADRAELLGNNLDKSAFLEATYTPSTVVKSRQSLSHRKAAQRLMEDEAAQLRKSA